MTSSAPCAANGTSPTRSRGGLRSARGTWKIDNLSDPATRLGQSPLRSGSVFNFFRPGYVPPSTPLATTGQVAPEFQIVTETSVSGYLNFMQNVIRFGYYVNAPDLPQGGSSAANGFDITCSYANLLPLVADAAALVRKVATPPPSSTAWQPPCCW